MVKSRNNDRKSAFGEKGNNESINREGKEDGPSYSGMAAGGDESGGQAQDAEGVRKAAGGGREGHSVKTSFTSRAGPTAKETYSKQASERRKL